MGLDILPLIFEQDSQVLERPRDGHLVIRSLGERQCFLLQRACCCKVPFLPGNYTQQTEYVNNASCVFEFPVQFQALPQECLLPVNLVFCIIQQVCSSLERLRPRQCHRSLAYRQRPFQEHSSFTPVTARRPERFQCSIHPQSQLCQIHLCPRSFHQPPKC